MGNGDGCGVNCNRTLAKPRKTRNLNPFRDHFFWIRLKYQSFYPFGSLTHAGSVPRLQLARTILRLEALGFRSRKWFELLLLSLGVRMKLFSKLLGSKNDRELKKLQSIIDQINSHEPELENLSDEELAARIGELKKQVQEPMRKIPFADLTKEQINKELDPILPETFAIVREAGKRVLGMRHYDVQMVGGIVLHSGRIAEMKTGEGKTLVATLPAVLNALTGFGVHVVTVNDYLASRDAEWMGRIYRFLGLTVGVVVARQGERAKRAAYQADICYGQNNEFGFDYLRDNMKFSLSDYKQRFHAFSIVDEVDSILIDEARTPLIISGAAEDNSALYRAANSIVPMLRKDEHYTIDEKSRNALLTETGVLHAEKKMGLQNLYDPDNIDKLHHLSQALKAHALYKRDSDYVVDNNEVVIVDEHTGRLMPGRRWSDGLHGAIEAKENVHIQKESQTLATITFQNYFRMYKKLSGMTGTADTEAEEFGKIYDLDVLVIPTNKRILRDDQQDAVYKSEQEKFHAIADDIKEYHENGNPILVGTVSVERSEILSTALKKFKVPHRVLNAKMHRDEAGIVAQAGRLGAVTIATNMAGRGTDILLGGNPEFIARSKVAEAMGQSSEQVAEFAFLSGRPDLINIINLAERDRKSGKFLAQWEEQVDAIKAEAEEKNQSVEWPEDLPQNREDARKQIYEQRLAFYKEAIRLYVEFLPEFEKEAKAEKNKVLEAGGLRIIGTERHESRRIDNQLRGRAGRQGDPGSSRFYLSLEDDLMRIFGSEKMIRVMEALGMEDGIPIEAKMVTKSIANAQKRVEGMHFDSRKQLIEYDDVNNQQRKAIYALRRSILEADPSREIGEHEKPVDSALIRELVFDLVEDAIITATTVHCPEKTTATEWTIQALEEELANLLGGTFSLQDVNRNIEDVQDQAFSQAATLWNDREERMTSPILGQIGAFLYLQTIDARWKEHLQQLEHLREGIHMRAYGQRDPKQEYKKEGFNLFNNLKGTVTLEVLEKVYKAEIAKKGEDTAAELALMRKNRRKRAEALKKGQTAKRAGVGGKGQTGNGTGLGLSGNGNSSGATGLPQRSSNTPMNRAQRRQMKAKSRKGSRVR
jgi:preprotein translocase subunit SecA